MNLTPPFSLHQRAEIVDRLRGDPFDLVIIGGGINGAAIARDASLRGYRVALLEQADGRVKTAAVMHARKVERSAAEMILERYGGALRAALQGDAR